MSATTGEGMIHSRRELHLTPRLRSLLRGRTDDPAWVRPSLLGLVVATACLYLIDLSASGYANSFYSAAVQAGSTSWKAFFFGSFDSSNFITVDKPPASLWVMDISARIFGVNAWSILAPQALEGIASVGLLYLTVRRRFSPAAGLVAGAVLATTPVAALMFRFNNPDALLTLLLIASAYALTRALEHGGTRWLLLAGGLVGFGFLAKMMQSFVVVPGFGAVYLLAAPVALRRRLWQLAASGVAMVVSAGWWVAAVTLWPAGSRPYIGGSQDNSILNLIFGYNGFGRLTGNETGSVIGGRVVGAAGAAATGGGGAGGPGGAGGGSMWGPTGITRLFGSEMGTQISWLIPAALLFIVAGLWWTRRGARTDGRRAAVLIWGSWLVVTGLVFSFAQGIIHPYYTVALAPAIGALVGIGAVTAWGRRNELVTRLFLSTALAGTGVWSFVLLDRTPGWLPWLRYVVVAAGGGLAVLVVLGADRVLAGLSSHPTVRRGLLVAVLAVLLAAPVAYSVETASAAHTGSLPTAGPSGSTSGQGPGGRGGFGGGQGRSFGQGRGPGGANGFPGGGAPPTGGFGGQAPGSAGSSQTTGGQATGGFPAGGQAPGGTAGRTAGGGAIGGLLSSGTPDKAITTLLQKNASSYTWAAAVVGANSAAGFQLAADEPVMAIGGFNGTDPTPTLAAFKADVAAGKVHYFIASGSGNGGGGGGIGGSSSSSAIATWVAATFTPKTVGGVTLYDLTTTNS